MIFKILLNMQPPSGGFLISKNKGINMKKGDKKKVGRPSELAECLIKAKEYLLGGYETFGDVVPSVAGLACYLGKHKSSMYEYSKQNKEFSDTLEAIKTVQENKLINKGLTGEFNSPIVKLMLANHGYSEKQEIDHQSSDGSMSTKPIKVELVSPDE